LKFRKKATQAVVDASRFRVPCAAIGGQIVTDRSEFLELVQADSNSTFAKFAIVKPDEDAYVVGTLVPNENIYRGRGFPITDIPREVQRWRFLRFWIDRPLQLVIRVNQPGLVRIMTFSNRSQREDGGWRLVCTVTEKGRYGWSVLEKHFSKGLHLIPIFDGRSGSRLLFR
jgi:hypothetical protein